MEKEFLQGLGLEEETVSQILTQHGAELSAVQNELSAARAELETLQAKYDIDITELQNRLSERDYSDAINKAVSGAGLKFSSKAAERDFMARLREQKLELKDGELAGLDDFIKAQKESDPDAFVKPAPRFVASAGSGGEPAPRKTTAEQIAETIGKARAESNQAAENVISRYTGGKN